MFFEDHIDDAKYCGHLYGLGSGSAYVQNGTGNAYEEEANKQQSWHHPETLPSCSSHPTISAVLRLRPRLRQPDENNNGRSRNIYTSFSKLFLISSAHLRQLSVMVKKKREENHSCAHTCLCCVCVCVSLVFYSFGAALDKSGWFSYI